MAFIHKELHEFFTSNIGLIARVFGAGGCQVEPRFNGYIRSPGTRQYLIFTLNKGLGM